MKYLRPILSFILFISFVQHSISQVVAYPLPACYQKSAQFSVAVNSTEIPVTAYTDIYEYASYSFCGQTTVTITASETIKSFRISPLSLGINATVIDNKLTFTLDQSHYLIVKINSLKDLVIAADDLEKDIPSSSGNGVFNVLQSPYNADNTGTQVTTAIQKAIDNANSQGGGIVYLPAGVYLTGNIMLKSNVSIYLAGGAVIRGTGNMKDYITHFRKSSLDMNGTWFIYTATNANNMKIYGRGTIDGNGLFMRQNSSFLNNLLVLLQCSNFTIDGIVFRDSGSWGLTITRSNDVVIKNTKHFNENNVAYEDDAIDIQESQNVFVQHTIAVSEDDTYSTKTWNTSTDIASKWPGSPEILKNVVFDDCLAWSRCATFKIGFGVFMDQSDITFKNSTSYRSMKAIAVDHNYGGHTAQNITFENIDIEGFWPRKGNSSKWLDFNVLTGGTVKNIYVENINVRDVGNSSSVISATSTSTLDDVFFENIIMHGSNEYAQTLEEMNVVANEYATNISIINNPTDINENILSFQTIHVFPSVFTNQVNFEINLLKEDKVTISILNLFGQTISTNSGIMFSGLNSKKINLGTSLPSGLYLSKIVIGTKQSNFKLIKK